MTEDEARQRLEAAGASTSTAAIVAAALAENEAEGNAVCGWYYLPVFEAQLRSGRIRGAAEPVIERRGAIVLADAGEGFAQPAINNALPSLIEATCAHGVGVLSVTNSYNALALGPWVRRLAEDGLIGLAFANAPASVAPPGARKAIYGTNPFALAVPVDYGAPIVLDQATSAVAKTEILMRAEAERALEAGWAQDSSGQPTLEAGAALKGALLPAGGRKGAGVALLVEVLAAVATGGALSAHASPLGDENAPHPKLGQLLIALCPASMGGGNGTDLVRVMKEAQTHIPGTGRAAALKGVQTED